MAVERVGVSFEPELLKKFDAMIAGKGYTNRSEAIRDMARDAISKSETSATNGTGIGTITILYDHDAGNVTENLLHLQHGVLYNQHATHKHERHSHHTVHPHGVDILATMHVHVSESDCLEVIVVRGNCTAISRLADNIRAIKGVKHGELVMTSTAV